MVVIREIPEEVDAAAIEGPPAVDASSSIDKNADAYVKYGLVEPSSAPLLPDDDAVLGAPVPVLGAPVPVLAAPVPALADAALGDPVLVLGAPVPVLGAPVPVLGVPVPVLGVPVPVLGAPVPVLGDPALADAALDAPVPVLALADAELADPQENPLLGDPDLDGYTVVRSRRYGRVRGRYPEPPYVAPPETPCEIEVPWLPKAGSLRKMKQWSQARQGRYAGTSEGLGFFVYGSYGDNNNLEF